MEPAFAFRDWVLEPDRTSEELFLAELLVEAAEWHDPHYRQQNFRTRLDAEQARRRRRAADPAYRPRLARKRVDEALPHLASLTSLSLIAGYEEKKVRDLSALRFVPTLREFSVHTELRDLSGLEKVPGLTSLSIHDDRLRDLSVLRLLPRLETVHFYLKHPWPNLEGLASLDACRRIHLHLNLPLLDGLASWPSATHVNLSARSSAPLRDLRRLPSMPVLKELTVEVASLDGIERYRTVEKLELRGIFEDLSPLAGLPCLRALTLDGEHYEDLGPLAKLPELRELKLERERGLVLDPLLEAPRLRAVSAPRCRVIATELSSLNAAIAWQPEDFLLDTPRKIPPLRVLVYDPSHPDLKNAKATPDQPDERERAAQGDTTFLAAELACVCAHVTRILDGELRPGWGRVRPHVWGTTLYISFIRDLERHEAWSTLGLVGSALAATRYTWDAEIAFDEDDEDDWEDEEPKDEDGIYVESPEDIENRRNRIRERQAFLEREHQLRLGAQGLPVTEVTIDEPPPLPPPRAEEPEDAEEKLDDSVYRPPTTLRLIMDESRAWVALGWIDEARAILGREPEDWHKLPGPPEQRPKPL